MKKIILYFLSLILLISGILIFVNLNKDFNNVSYIEIFDRDNKSEDKFTKQITVKSDKDIMEITNLLNKANRLDNVNYEMAYVENYRMKINYADSSKDTLRIWKQSNNILIRSDSKSVFYKLTNKANMTAFIKIIDEK
jgi:hypothetical protein